MKVTEAYDLTTRTVKLTVENATEPMPCGTPNQPRRFLPESVELEWRNGVLEYVRINGPRVLKDGSRSITRDGITVWADGPNVRDDQLPDWVREEIARYTDVTVRV